MFETPRTSILIAACSALLLAAMVAPAVWAAGGQIAINDTRTTSFPRISLRMAVSDSEGVPLGDLESANFEVLENGQPVYDTTLQTVRQSSTPLSIVLVVDVSGSMKDDQKLDKAREAANSFIAGLRGVDQVELISFSATVATVVPFTNNRQLLAGGLQKLTPAGDTAFYDALYAAVGEAARRTGNRVVLALTDGEDTASKATFQQPVDLAAQLGIPVYTIGLGQDVKDDILRAVAESTSGHYLKAPGANDLAYTFKLLSQQIQNQYELTYVSRLSESTGGSVNVTVTARLGGQPVTTKFTYEIPKAVQKDPVGVLDPGQLRRVPQPELPPAPPVQLPPYLAELAVLLAALGVLAIFTGLLIVNSRTLRERRLETYVGAPARPGGPLVPRVRFNPMRWFNHLVYRGFGRLLPKSWLGGTRRLMVMAGYPPGHGVEGFVGMRVLMTVGGAVAGFLLFLGAGDIPELPWMMAFAMGGIGFLLPTYLLKVRVKSRQEKILRAMPNAMDLLSVSVEAGLGFDQALVEVCTKWQSPLTQEFGALLNEIRLGSSRKNALRGLMTRTGVPELGMFASALIQADELGASITRTLQSQAEEIRIRRRQRAQEKAHQAPVKMAFPLVFFMLPALFVVVLGPSVPSIMNALSGTVQ